VLLDVWWMGLVGAAVILSREITVTNNGNVPSGAIKLGKKQ